MFFIFFLNHNFQYLNIKNYCLKIHTKQALHVCDKDPVIQTPVDHEYYCSRTQINIPKLFWCDLYLNLCQEKKSFFTLQKKGLSQHFCGGVFLDLQHELFIRNFNNVIVKVLTYQILEVQKQKCQNHNFCYNLLMWQNREW